jgi:hypothetical protein
MRERCLLYPRKWTLAGSNGMSAECHHPYEQCPVGPAQSKTRRRTSQRDVELMTKEKVLGFKLPPGLEQVGDEHSERV